MTFAEKLTKLMDERNLSDGDVARRIGRNLTSGPSVNRWKNGEQEPRLSVAVKLAEVLGVPLTLLAYEEASVSPEEPGSDSERQCWKIIRLIGGEEAWRRLAGIFRPVVLEGGFEVLPEGDGGPGRSGDGANKDSENGARRATKG